MTTDKTQRKERPIARGVLDYFPDAIADVANVSFVGNQQHNPGQEMHWAKDKSPDHADCVARHLIERGTRDNDGLRHSAKAAWRALAMLQIEIEKDQAEPPAYESGNFEPSATDSLMSKEAVANADYRNLKLLGCPEAVAKQIIGGTTYACIEAGTCRRIAYVAGPMRGYDAFNFPAFDKARDALVRSGWDVISPADIDRATETTTDPGELDVSDQTRFVFRDFWSLYFLKKMDRGENAIAVLPNWWLSVGAKAELSLAKWLKLSIIDATTGNPIGDDNCRDGSRLDGKSEKKAWNPTCEPSSSATSTNPWPTLATATFVKTLEPSTR